MKKGAEKQIGFSEMNNKFGEQFQSFYAKCGPFSQTKHFIFYPGVLFSTKEHCNADHHEDGLHSVHRLNDLEYHGVLISNYHLCSLM